MNLSKSDALFLHSLLFHVLTKKWSSTISSKIENVMLGLEKSLFEVHHEDEDEDEDEDQSSVETVDEEEVEHYVLAGDLHELPALAVTQDDGTSVKMEFEYLDEHDPSLDLLIDGNVVLENVGHIKVTNNDIYVYSWADEEVQHFFVKRLTKKWKQVLPQGLSEVTFPDSDDQEDEEE